jgi:hypothetical protein
MMIHKSLLDLEPSRTLAMTTRNDPHISADKNYPPNFIHEGEPNCNTVLHTELNILKQVSGNNIKDTLGIH